ncbi:hypothetical protein [Streptomyces sp.]|uniref:hypothetical protein n=1 Tax=Streptomyces sp. TaxID=1931 RepID=UPI002F42006B
MCRRVHLAGGVEAGPVPGPELPSATLDGYLLVRVAGAVDATFRVDAATRGWLDQLLAAHRTAEDYIGSRPLVGITRQQLSTVVDLTSRASSPSDRRGQRGSRAGSPRPGTQGTSRAHEARKCR